MDYPGQFSLGSVYITLKESIFLKVAQPRKCAEHPALVRPESRELCCYVGFSHAHGESAPLALPHSFF